MFFIDTIRATILLVIRIRLHQALHPAFLPPPLPNAEHIEDMAYLPSASLHSERHSRYHFYLRRRLPVHTCQIYVGFDDPWPLHQFRGLRALHRRYEPCHRRRDLVLADSHCVEPEIGEVEEDWCLRIIPSGRLVSPGPSLHAKLSRYIEFTLS